MTTSHEIAPAWWIHITWNGDTGIDQRGRQWVNPGNPTMKHGYENLLRVMMEGTNLILKTMRVKKDNG